MYKKGAGNDKQRKDAGNRTLCLYRNFSQAMSESTPPAKVERKESSDKKELGKAALDWAQLIYNEIFEIKLQVRNVLYMKLLPD